MNHGLSDSRARRRSGLQARWQRLVRAQVDRWIEERQRPLSLADGRSLPEGRGFFSSASKVFIATLDVTGGSVAFFGTKLMI